MVTIPAVRVISDYRPYPVIDAYASHKGGKQGTMADPVLKFLTNEAGEKEGLGDAGIETFRDSPYASCAREAGQNSRDAAREKPVRMTFNVL